MSQGERAAEGTKGGFKAVQNVGEDLRKNINSFADDLVTGHKSRTAAGGHDPSGASSITGQTTNDHTVPSSGTGPHSSHVHSTADTIISNAPGTHASSTHGRETIRSQALSGANSTADPRATTTTETHASGTTHGISGPFTSGTHNTNTLTDANTTGPHKGTTHQTHNTYGTNSPFISGTHNTNTTGPHFDTPHATHNTHGINEPTTSGTHSTATNIVNHNSTEPDPGSYHATHNTYGISGGPTTSNVPATSTNTTTASTAATGTHPNVDPNTTTSNVHPDAQRTGGGLKGALDKVGQKLQDVARK